MILLSVLCHPHLGLLVASQPQQANSNISKPDPVDVAIAEGKRFRDQGNTAASVTAYQRALKLATLRNDLKGEMKSLIMMGVAQTRNFQYRAALTSLEGATMLAGQLHDNLLAGAAVGNIATIYSLVGDWPAAELEAARAVSLFRQILGPDSKASSFLALALQSHANICFELGKNAEGYSDSSEAIALAKSLGDRHLQVTMLDVRGFALMREHKTAEANSSLRAALSLSEQIHNPDDLAFVKEHLAELELQQSPPDCHLALQLIDEASTSHGILFKSQPEYLAIHLRAKILLALGDKPAALSEFLRAVNAANQWRLGALPGDTTNSQTVAKLQEVYQDYAQLAAEMALEKSNKALGIQALEVLAENRAASLRDQLRMAYGTNWKLPDEYFLKLSQLQSAQAAVTLGGNDAEDRSQLRQIRLEISALENQIGIKPENSRSLSERIPARNSLRDIQRRLSGDQVLISITLGKNQSYLWAVTGDSVRLSKLPAESELESKANAFSTAVRNNRESMGSADDLSHALFAGLPADVWNRSEWMLVADGPLLNGVPFGALKNLAGGNAGKPFVVGKSLRLLPSELLLLDRQTTGLGKSFVGVGDPIYNRADGRLAHAHPADAKSVSARVELARLAGSEKEIRSAASELGSVDPVLLTGEYATRENLRSALEKQADVIHFAVHVVSPRDQPEQAALALSVRNGVPQLLTPEVVASLHAPGSLVVLSGCSSGQGKVLPGTGLMGLSRAWLLAGAAAVVVSNWPTPDDSGKFFSSFYSHFDRIKIGDTAQRAALALDQTQIEMLGGTGYRTSAAFWGAFAVISKE